MDKTNKMSTIMRLFHLVYLEYLMLILSFLPSKVASCP